MWWAPIVAGTAGFVMGAAAAGAQAAKEVIEPIKRSYHTYYRSLDKPKGAPTSLTSLHSYAKEASDRQRPGNLGWRRAHERKVAQMIRGLRQAESAFNSFADHLGSVLEGLSTVLTDVNSLEEAPSSPSGKLPSERIGTQNRGVRDTPLSRASSPSLPDRPPSPAVDKTATERMQELQRSMKQEHLRAALREAMEKSTLPPSITSKSPSVPSVMTDFSQAKSVVASTPSLTLDMPSASPAPASELVSGIPPVAGSSSPDAAPVMETPNSVDPLPTRDRIIDSDTGEREEFSGNEDDDKSLQRTDSLESDIDNGTERSEKPDGAAEKV